AHWGAVDLTAFPGVSVYPCRGANPVDNDDRADYYDTLHYGAAIVGINTSAMIEAGIQDRPVFTIVDSSFDDTQTGTLHFRYLLPENGGHLQRATSLEEHARQLSRTIDDGVAPSSRQFVETFVRPHGLDTPATPRLVTALEGLENAVPTPPDDVPVYLLPLWAVLWVMTVFVEAGRAPRRWQKKRHRMKGAIWVAFKSKRKQYRKWRERRRRMAKKARTRERPREAA
ncbi:MAG: hypothetical protein ABGY72_03325, partial [bacterium]